MDLFWLFKLNWIIIRNIIMSRKSRVKQFYQVQSIVDSRVNDDGKKQYLIKWKGWSHSDNTWQPLYHLVTVQEMVTQFQLRQININVIKKIDKTHHKKRKPKICLNRKRRRQIQSNDHNKIQAISSERMKQDIQQAPKTSNRLQLFLKQSNQQVESEKLKIQISKPQQSSKNQRIIGEELQRLNPHLQQQQGEGEYILYQRLIQVQQQRELLQIQNQQILSVEKPQIKQNSIEQQPFLIIKKIQQRKKRLPRLETSIKIKKEKRSVQTHSIQLKQDKEAVEEMQQEPVKIQDEGIERILMNRDNIGLSTIILKYNTMIFKIPFTKGGAYDQFQTTADQIIKINPGWLESFFQGHYQ